MTVTNGLLLVILNSKKPQPLGSSGVTFTSHVVHQCGQHEQQAVGFGDIDYTCYMMALSSDGRGQVLS